MSKRRTSSIGPVVMLLAALVTAAPALAEVGQKKMCSHSFAGGCGADDAKAGPTAPASRASGPGSPGLGAGIVDMPYESSYRTSDDNGRIAGNTGTAMPGWDLTGNLETCANVLQHAVDVARAGSSRSSHPELNASDCISLDKNASLYGGFVNRCDYRVEFRFCAYRPKPGAWTESFDCERTQGGTELIEPGQRLGAHTKSAEMIYWGGCRFPEGSPADFEFRPGQGYGFRCYAWDIVEGDTSRDEALSNCSASAVEGWIRQGLEEDRRARQREREQQLAEQKRRQASAAAQQRAVGQPSAPPSPPPMAAAPQPQPQPQPAYTPPAPRKSFNYGGSFQAEVDDMVSACDPQIQAWMSYVVGNPNIAFGPVSRERAVGQINSHISALLNQRSAASSPAALRDSIAYYERDEQREPDKAWATCMARRRLEQVLQGRAVNSN